MLPHKIVQAVAQKAREEYDFSINVVQQKREYFRQNYSKVLNIGSDSKIYERLIFRMVDMMCALSHKFKPNVTFQKRSEDDAETIKYLELVKEFDYDEMEMGWKKYRVHRYKFIFGPGIEVRDTFNLHTSTPSYKVMNPMSRIPDVGFDINTGFRYHGFELECTMDELKNAKGFFDLVAMKDMERMESERSSEQMQTHMAMIQNRRLTDTATLPKGVYGVYQHFTTFEGNKYEIWLANDRTLPIYCRWIKPVLEEEKKNPSLVSYGVVVRRYRPLPNDPYGVSFAFDILSDKQKQIQTFHNLNLIKAKQQILGAKYIYDPEIITADNIDILQKSFEQPVYIPVPGMRNMQTQGVVEMPKPAMNTMSFEFGNQLESISIKDTSMDERTQGVSAGPQITRAESERVQLNANIRLILGANFDLTAEKEFYRVLWYREYIENKSKIREKFVEITNGVQVIPMLLGAKDFLTKYDPRMKAVSTVDAEESKEKKRLSFMAVFNTLYAGATSEFGKRKLMKIMAELHGVEDNIVNAVFGQSLEEMQARSDLDLINKGIVPKVGSIEEDHDTYIDIYNLSHNTETKLKAIAMRHIAKIAKEEMMKGQEDQNNASPVSEGMQNQALSQSSNKSKQSVNSLQDIS